MTWHTLGRHQLGSLAATVVDFGTMTALVAFALFGATAATAVGATLGGVTNFCLGRSWIFRATAAAAAPQAVRYGVVSAASAGWNVLGEHLLHDRLGVQFLVARLLVAVLVSVLWNFPLQRAFVFRAVRSAGAASP